MPNRNGNNNVVSNRDDLTLLFFNFYSKHFNLIKNGLIMSYVVYVNHPTNRATIHTIYCGKYQNRKSNMTPNGFWSKEFANPEDAEKFAYRTGKKTIHVCVVCMPELHFQSK